MSQPIPENQLRQWLAAAEIAARQGGAVLEKWRTRFSVREKARADLVTDADLASQNAIRSVLQGTFSTHSFLGEEEAPGVIRGGVRADAPPTWIVDPLDGTTNYVHDVPCYCVSVGLLVEGELVVGVIFDPRQKEAFSAARGLGASLNGQTIRVSTVEGIGKALLSTGFPPDPAAQDRNLACWGLLSKQVQALRRTGSTAINMAYVACGRFDGYWGFDNHAWDIAAGVVLIREAGGMVSRADGSTLDPFQPDVLATNGHLHREVLPKLRTVN